MRILEKRILSNAQVIKNEVLNVDDFMTQTVDTNLMIEIGKEFEHHFGNKKIDRILTVESTGIALAMATSAFLHVPFVFARKKPDPLMQGDSFLIPAYSYTKDTTYHLSLLKKMLPPEENILILDSFLSNGETLLGLVNMVRQANCNLVGIGTAIEKGFRPGRQKLEAIGCKVVSLVKIEKFEDGKPVFAKRPV